MYVLTQPPHRRRSTVALLAALSFATVLAALVWPCRTAAGQVGSLLPGPLRHMRVDGVSIGLDGRLRLDALRWEGVLAGVRVEAEAAVAFVSLGGRGVDVPDLTLRLDLAPDEAVSAGEAPVFDPSVVDGRSELPDERGPVARAIAAARRAARLLGPVTVGGGRVLVERGGVPVAQVESLAVRLAPEAAAGDASAGEAGGGGLRGVVSGLLATSAVPGGAPTRFDAEVVHLADGDAVLNVSLRDLDLSASLAGWRAALRREPSAFLRQGMGSLELTLTLPKEGPLQVSGRAAVRDLVIEHPAVAPEPVAFRRLGARFGGVVDRNERRVRVATEDGRLNEAAVDVALELVRRGTAWHIDATLRLPEQPCHDLMDAVPDALLGELRDSRWGGVAGFALRLTVDTDDPGALRLRLDGEPDGCVPETLGASFDRALERLTTPFATPVNDPSGATPPDLAVGPGTVDFVPYDEIPHHVRVAALATEDRRFFHHRGVSLRLIQGALQLDLAKKEYFYGGSTITQQLVKNLLLSRQKTLARKFQELLLAREVERVLTKERILELYLNCIEYGPGVFGLGAAARFYFRKDTRALDPLEGAFLMALKPSPRTGFLVFRRGELNQRWRDKLRTILQRMVKLGGIDQATADAAAPYQPDFVPYDPAIHASYPRR